MRTFILTLLLTLTFHPIMAQKVTSILEIYDITTGQRTVVKEFPKHLIEAPNWTPDGQWLVCIYLLLRKGFPGPALDVFLRPILPSIP